MTVVIQQFERPERFVVVVLCCFGRSTKDAQQSINLPIFCFIAKYCIILTIYDHYFINNLVSSCLESKMPAIREIDYRIESNKTDSPTDME
jgi:hypothetical protein